MTPQDIARVLAKAAAFDQRTVGHTDILAWLEAIGDLDCADALEAVTRHYRETTNRLMPVHIRVHVAEIADERRRAELRRQRAEFEAQHPALPAVPTEDRSAEVKDLLTQLAAKLGTSDPTVLRRREWVRAEQLRQRVPEANPHYVGPPPPGGHPLPVEDAS